MKRIMDANTMDGLTLLGLSFAVAAALKSNFGEPYFWFLVASATGLLFMGSYVLFFGKVKSKRKK